MHPKNTHIPATTRESPCKNLHATPGQTRKHLENKWYFTFQEQTAVSQACKLVMKTMVSEARMACTCSVALGWKHYNWDTHSAEVYLSGDHSKNHQVER